MLFLFRDVLKKEVDDISGAVRAKSKKNIPVVLSIDEVRSLFRQVEEMHTQDLELGFGEVYLPPALARKYPQAAKEWRWQYVFPSAKLAVGEWNRVVVERREGGKTRISKSEFRMSNGGRGRGRRGEYRISNDECRISNGGSGRGRRSTEDGGLIAEDGDRKAVLCFADSLPARIASRLKPSERKFLKSSDASIVAIRLEWVE